MHAEFDKQEERLLRSLAEVLEEFSALRSNIPLHQIVMFLRLAINEGKSQKFYSDEWGIPTSTVSRGMLDLGKRMRKGEEGLGLVDERVSRHSLREHEIYLSVQGRKLLQRSIEKLIGKK